MKKIVLFAIIGFFVASTAFAQGATVAKTINGILIDNKCASTQNLENLADFVKTHTKQCTLMPDSVANGYSLFANGKLTKFTKKSSPKIKEFLEKPDSTLTVTVVVDVIQTKAGKDIFKLVSIENKK
jgi:hypothetical protein